VTFRNHAKELLTKFAGYNENCKLLTGELVSNGLPKLEIARNLHQAGVIDRSLSMNLELVFQEALSNAIEHGNLELESELREQFDSSGVDLFSQLKFQRLQLAEYAQREIEISIKIIEEALEIIIKDQGKGFNIIHKKVQSQEQLHGRGLTIIYSSMDLVDYKDNGRCLVMKKNLLF
jgi:anti-sigma regulatory factor (Ser/Thr protein kinase)